jgi:hypothetical protein
MRMRSKAQEPVSPVMDVAKGWVETNKVLLDTEPLPALASLSTMEVGDRVNAELQRAPARSEARQVGVPALAGLSAMREKASP